MSSKKLLFAYGRSVTGLLIGGLFWWFMGWALSHRTLGDLLAVWAWLVGPLLLPPITWFWLRFRKKIQLLDLSREPVLAREYFTSVVRHPGPRPRVWVRTANDLSLFWCESHNFGSRQEIFLTTTWMRQDRELQTRDWQSLWFSIAALTPAERRLRSFQMAAWCGVMSPLEFFFQGFQMLLDVIGLSDTPQAGFWFQRCCWALKSLWFGTLPERGQWPVAAATGGFKPPSIWNSVIWGVWFQIPERSCHPTWTLLTHSDALLRSPETSPARS